jgi:hypothetical protein
LGQPSDIDRLIEMGLNRYGAGDLEGALILWEEALAIDPDNAQANSYVDYVRSNYELLAMAEPSVEAEQAPFPIEEEPEYVIEVEPGEEPPEAETVTLASRAAMLEVDAGWDAEETYHSRKAFTVDLPHAGDLSLELEPEEPEVPDEPPARDVVSFEDATREYHGIKGDKPPPPSSDFTAEPTFDQSAQSEFSSDEFTGGFANSPGTPVGFASQETEIRRRDLGFVQPTAQGHDDNDEPIEPPPPLESGEIRLPAGPKGSTREMPQPTRQPARLDPSALSQAEVMLPHAPTRELSKGDVRVGTLDPKMATAPTRELSDHDLRARMQPAASSAPTRELPRDAAFSLDPLLSTPTRDIGTRPGGRPPLTSPSDDDAPTGQTDARAIRAAAARQDGRVERADSESGTRHDIVLGFDPIAAQSAQIMEEVDAGAPVGEATDDRTRRRITRLLELAGEWNQAGQLDRAVCAVDLALSEEPNSALAQKLITRHKDTVMALFQAYLGDLERMPHLAKALHELGNAPIGPRAAFLLSRIDGTITIDELLDVSGMPRLEAYRHLCQLYLRGILR